MRLIKRLDRVEVKLTLELANAGGCRLALAAVRDSRKNVTATPTRPIPVFTHSPIHSAQIVVPSVPGKFQQHLEQTKSMLNGLQHILTNHKQTNHRRPNVGGWKASSRKVL
jgi:hypothetical protein